MAVIEQADGFDLILGGRLLIRHRADAPFAYLGAGEPRKSQQVVLDGHVGTAGAAVKWGLRREK